MIVSNGSLTAHAPQIWPIDPRMGSRSTFTSSYVTIQTEALAGAYNGTLGDKDIFYLAYTQVTTPTCDIHQQPGGLAFGNFVFDLTAYVNGAPFERFYFGQPVTLTVTYDPALLGEMDDELLTMLFWDGREWSDKGIQSIARDQTAHRLTVVISHLSEYAFFASVQAQHLHLPAIAYSIPP